MVMQIRILHHPTTQILLPKKFPSLPPGPLVLVTAVGYLGKQQTKLKPHRLRQLTVF